MVMEKAAMVSNVVFDSFLSFRTLENIATYPECYISKVSYEKKPNYM